MIPLPRNKVAPDSPKLYKSLGSLIKDYREWRALSQENFATLTRISVRELQNWEADRHNIRIDNLHDLSELTGIPMQACVALNARQPLWYSLRKRRFAHSSVEEALLSSYELLRHPEQADDELITNNCLITKDKHIRMILSCHDDIYGAKLPLGREAIEAACAILPDFNRIVFDSWGHYVGHQVCFPIKHELYQQIKKKKNFKSMTADSMSDIVAQQEGAFYIYSFFMTDISVAHSLLINNCRCAAKIEPKERYTVARIEITEKRRNMSTSSDLNLLANKVYGNCLQTEMIPAMHEIKLNVLMRQYRKTSETSKLW
ncbi:MAG: helix-turn-helix transcriptional regulator [Syntrophales bacterium]